MVHSGDGRFCYLPLGSEFGIAATAVPSLVGTRIDKSNIGLVALELELPPDVAVASYQTSGSVIRLLAEPRAHIAEVGPIKVPKDVAWLPKRLPKPQKYVK